MTPKRKAAFAMQQGLPERIFDAPQLRRLREIVDIDPERNLSEPLESCADLAEIEILITGWGAPSIDSTALAAAPVLAAVMHTGGSVKGHVSLACWDRGIAVSSAAEANAIPVAQYTLAMILLATKSAFAASALYRRRRNHIDREIEFSTAGAYERTVGVIGASRVGRRLLTLLAPFDFEILVTDPFLNPDEAAALGARLVDLDELMAASDVVTVHAPELPSTAGLIGAGQLALMRDGSTLINTSRGSLVDQPALTAELTAGRLNAILDVTIPEVLPADSQLYHLENVVLTPHIAGAMGTELHRLAASTIDEIERFVSGRPLLFGVDRGHLERVA